MKLVGISVCTESLAGLALAAAELDREAPGWGSVELFGAIGNLTEDEAVRLTRAVADAQVVLVDLMGADPRYLAAVTAGLDSYRGHLIAIGSACVDRARLGSFTLAGHSRPPSDMPVTRMRPTSSAPGGKADATRYAALVRAFQTMDTTDGLFIVTSLLHHYFDRADIQPVPPSSTPDGVFVTDPATSQRFSSVAAYVAEYGDHDGKPVVALLYYGRRYPNNTAPIAAQLATALAPVCWVLPIAISQDAATAVDGLRQLFTTPGYRPELIINLMSFRLGAGPRGGDAASGTQLLGELGAGYLKPLIVAKRNEVHWRSNPAGLSPAEVLVSMMLPEMDGCLDQIPIALLADDVINFDQVHATGSLRAVDEQIQHVVGRVRGHLRLRQLANADKRVAIIGYDYPAGEGNLLGGAFLDTAASIEAILADQARQGYQVQPPPPGQLLRDLLAQAVNSPSYISSAAPITYPRADAEADLDDERAWAAVHAAWPPDSNLPMVDGDGNYLIGAVQYGNVLVGIQPGRGLPAAEAVAHDMSLPPHPQYLAFYTWLRHCFRPDVIVHVGTHGTLEFLQGRENAVSARCFPDLMMADIPHVYLYYCGNAAEALIARRRSHACLVSYHGPVMRPGGLHDGLAEVAELLAAYRRSLDMSPQTSQETLAELQAAAEALHLPGQPSALEAELDRIACDLVPLGLHVFGRSWDADEVTAMVQGVLARGLADFPAGVEVIARARGLEVAEIDGLAGPERAKLEQHAADLVAVALAHPEVDPCELAGQAELAELVRQARVIGARFAANDEWDGLAKALSGRYVQARLGGDLTRNPQVMPSGGSLYQFDPRQVPTALAVRRGAQIAAGVCQLYRQTHEGQYPRCVGVVLWGLETSRTHGETYAQIMAHLGVRLTGPRRPGTPRWEIIPTAELTGPRVDVVVTICGFFRDLFGQQIAELDDMFAAVAALDEPADINPIAAQAQQAAAALRATGHTTAEASQGSRARIFGPAPGRYGTGLTDIIEGGNWQSVEDLAAAFGAATSHAYGRYQHGVPSAQAYRHHLASIEVVSQTRSSNEYQITDLDHYFEYLGGLTAAVTAARGTEVPTLVTDTTGRTVHTSTVAEAAGRGLYTRLLNPEWIAAMLAHGHRGVAEIADRATNLLGLAATTGQLDGWMFDAVFERFIADQQMREDLAAANPHATAHLAAQLAQADQRGLWESTGQQRELLDVTQFDIDSELEQAGDDITIDDPNITTL